MTGLRFMARIMGGIFQSVISESDYERSAATSK